MTFADLSPLANHIWQSTLFAISAWLLTMALRKNRASVRYWVWFAASVKFLIPFSVLISIGSKFAWQSSSVAIAQPQFANVISEIGEPFAPLTGASTAVGVPHASSALPLVLIVVWLCGAIVGLVFWLRSVRQIRAIKRGATALPITLLIPVMSSRARMEPGISGIFKPVLILPEGIAERLTPAQMEAVFAHEMCHVRRRDNLTAAIHMVVEVIFWFHPVVWGIRTQLVTERERACDEAVVDVANDPEIYAEAILNVCKLYMESPLRCVSGVSGSDLKRRIRTIVTGQVGGEMTLARKLLLAGAAAAAIAAPILVGAAPALTDYKYDVISVKPADPSVCRTSFFCVGKETDDGLHVVEGPRATIQWAYGLVINDQLQGVPSWFSSLYEIDAKMDEATADALQKLRPDERTLARQQMLQALLAERYKLVVH